jgi:hypothetical protein
VKASGRALYQRHPWLAQIMSFTLPLVSPRLMAHGEWAMRADQEPLPYGRVMISSRWPFGSSK